MAAWEAQALRDEGAGLKGGGHERIRYGACCRSYQANLRKKLAMSKSSSSRS